MLRKLLLLSLTLILSWNSFSQTVTEIKDTSGIVLTTKVARQVVTDILEGDQAREESTLKSAEILELKQVVALQDSLGNMRENQIANLENVIKLQQLQAQQNLEDTNKLNKEIRKQSNLKVMFETTTGIAVVALIATLIFGGK